MYKLIIFVFVISALKVNAQGCANLNVQFKSDIPSVCGEMTMTMIHDVLNRPYLYVANKEAGLRIYNLTSLTSPLLADSIQTSMFDTLDVMNLTQDGNYVYLALGNTFSGTTQKSGLAIIDVTNPTNAVLKDYWTLAGSSGGSGIVKVEGNYAYLGSMGDGLVILDISDKTNILFVSQFIPDINYPTASPNPALYNARGMEVKNSIVYLCYDAGGFRIINATNKIIPVQTGKYSNPVMNGHPRAYNNIILDPPYVYIAVDYCGVEVLNISDTSNITLSGWWNPYNCPSNNWFTSPVHSNEIQFDQNCEILFLSTGKSDMYIVNIANPSSPDSCGFYGGEANGIGTWGVGLFQNQIYLSYICTFGIPFASNWTGVKILTYTECSSGKSELNEDEVNSYPNPTNGKLKIFDSSAWQSAGLDFTISDLNVYTIFGENISPRILIDRIKGEIDLSEQIPGIYFIRISVGDSVFTKKVVRL